MRAQFEEGLRKAEASQHLSNEPHVPTGNGNVSRWRPWERANTLIKAKNSNLPKDSSVRLVATR